MTALCDLHTHTTASDGQYAPAQLVKLAKERGLSVLAVTDHDAIAGVDEAQRAGETLGIQVIRGVELSAKDYPNCHILGYGFRDGDTELARLCEQFRAGREERKYRIVDFLREKGVDIDLNEVEELAGGEVIARPHFARARVKRFKADAKTCVEAVKAAGGKVSLAHPYQMGFPDGELEGLVSRLKVWGLDAIECFYPKYTLEQQQFYLHLADKYELHQTGGSDFHGEQVKPDVELAALELELEWLLQA